MSKKNQADQESAEVIIIPSTHWDREWYLPFQHFRYKLVKLIDELLEIMEKKEYYFMLDGQTIVLEDYFEIRPENRERLLKLIREKKISVGPWYILPDEWLVGQESLIRNLEVSFDLASSLDIPQMQVGYLPDQFGHTRAIPQLLSDLTNFTATVMWRGVGPEITKVPFIWKSHPKSKSQILGNYLPFSYGNFAGLSDNIELVKELIDEKIKELKPYSPFPYYLLMNGTDHQLPQTFLIEQIPKLSNDKLKLRIGLMEEYILKLQDLIACEKYSPAIYYGEFRSSVKAPLLQDTYSARMWIKQWDTKIEDLLIHHGEPISAILHFYLAKEYPTSYLNLAWKWLLKNQPHDSICGCSVDKTHDEMKSRYSWAEGIVESVIQDSLEMIQKMETKKSDSSGLLFNPTNNAKIPMCVEFSLDDNEIKSIETPTGEKYNIQAITSSEDIFFESTMSPLITRAGLKMLPGRRLMDIYINEVSFAPRYTDPTVLDISLICGKEPIGEFDVKAMQHQAIEILDRKEFKKFHVKVSLGSKQSYIALLPLNPWSFSKVTLKREAKKADTNPITITKNSVSNQFFDVTFNKNGSLNLYDKGLEREFSNLHYFEDWGDRGDEYTFGRLGPLVTKVSKVKRRITLKGALVSEITQELIFNTFKKVNEKREKRIGKTKVIITTVFRFYRDLPRIDITTKLVNTAKDHRFRICFPMPFETTNTLTSTHFGYTERLGKAIENKDAVEQPSGIQPQKRFIRVESEEKDQTAFTLINKGLPEVELVDKSILALTLIRSIGFLSRSDFPERPIHAGPYLETPGAQELGQEYQFRYSFLCHSKEKPITFSADHSEAFCLETQNVVFKDSMPLKDLTKPLIEIENQNLRLSSMRIRDGKLQVLIFNLSSESIQSGIKFHKQFSKFIDVKIDGTIKQSSEISKNMCTLTFNPFEIKLLRID